MIFYFAFALIGLIVLFCIYVAFLPADFRIERSVEIDASPAIVFPYFNNFVKGELWNPFSKNDPTLKIDFEGPTDGVGAKMSWKGNAQSGAGRALIVESTPNERVRVQLDFLKPFKGQNFSVYVIRAENGRVVASWTMSGCTHFIPRAVSVFITMEKLLGGFLEKGLRDLKSIAEGQKQTGAL